MNASGLPGRPGSKFSATKTGPAPGFLAGEGALRGLSGGPDDADYAAVNGNLGIDTETGKGDWPSGMLSHAAGRSDDGNFVVTEVWASRATRPRSSNHGSARRWARQA